MRATMRHFCKRIITGDQTWCFFFYHPQYTTWKLPLTPRSKQCRQNRFRGKLMLEVLFWWLWHCVHGSHFVNEETYVQNLGRLRKSNQSELPNEGGTTHLPIHDNTPVPDNAPFLCQTSWLRNTQWYHNIPYTPRTCNHINFFPFRPSETRASWTEFPLIGRSHHYINGVFTRDFMNVSSSCTDVGSGVLSPKDITSNMVVHNTSSAMPFVHNQVSPRTF